MRLAAALALALAAAPAAAQEPSGSYLAARAAMIGSDFDEAARYYMRALGHDPGNPALLEAALTAQIGAGDVAAGVPVARRLVQEGQKSQTAAVTLFAEAARTGRWDAMADDLAAGQSAGELTDDLLIAWAEIGRGEAEAADRAFDVVAEDENLTGFADYHRALADALEGRFEDAAEHLRNGDGEPLRLDRRGTLAHIQILSQLDRNDDALALLDETFGADPDPGLAALVERLRAGETVPFDIVESARDGVAEVLYSIASALNGDASDPYTLIYLRLTNFLREGHVEALLMAADLLERMERYKAAVEVYDAVPEDDPAYHAAALGRAEALRMAGDPDGAIAAMEALADSHGDLPVVLVTLGDTLRGEERYEEARDIYNRAVALIGEPEPHHWIVFFARGIAHERIGEWPPAERDFRRALELNPEQPQVLNYLGYMLVERREKLDEALTMIETAVEEEPNSGYIADSLGWVLYRLGRFEEAVEPMERAAALTPVDPVINDHLGDVYWAVGRRTEARFQWRRALSFATDEAADETTDADPDRIRRKLEVGLDAVLAEEGAPPLTARNEN